METSTSSTDSTDNKHPQNEQQQTTSTTSTTTNMNTTTMNTTTIHCGPCSGAATTSELNGKLDSRGIAAGGGGSSGCTIFVKTQAGTVSVSIDLLTSTVDNLKAEVRDVTGVPVQDQRLVTNGKQLETESGDGARVVLADFGVSPGATVELLLSLLGGKRCDGSGTKPCPKCYTEFPRGHTQCNRCEGSGSQGCGECDGDGCDECDYCGTVACRARKCDGGYWLCCRCDGEATVDCNGCSNCN